MPARHDETKHQTVNLRPAAPRSATTLNSLTVFGFLLPSAVQAGGALLICGPGAPVCAIALVLAGSAAGGIAGSLAADALDDELEEFSKWDVF